MKLSLRNRILWWSAGTTLALLFATIVLVDDAFRSTILHEQELGLVAQARLISEIHQAEVSAGIDQTVALAAIPTVKAAVETGDPPTIRQNLDLLIEEAPFDWLLLTTPDGSLIAATSDAPITSMDADRTRRLTEEAIYYDTADLLRTELGIVEVYATSVTVAGQPVAILLAGVQIGADRIERFEAATEQQIAIISGRDLVAGGIELDQAGRTELTAAWMVDESAIRSGDAPAMPTVASVREFELGGREFIGAIIPLPDSAGSQVACVVAFRPLDEAMMPARTLRNTLLGIGLAGLLIALAASFMVARRVTRPVDRLLEETVRLGGGDLDTPIAQIGDDEIGRLAAGFESMRRSLKETREELVRAERLSALGQAASAIVHDFRQPVTVIQGHISLLRMDLDDVDAREEDIVVIEEQISRLNTMMSEILDFARGSDAMNPTAGSVQALIDDVTGSVRPLFSQQQIALDVVPSYPGEWILDFPRTRRVLENLVRNAAAAVGPGGSVTLKSVQENGHLSILVEDTGPGIPVEIRERLFEPFVTHGKREGTGLGLAIVKTFTEKQGGTVTVETSDKGTRFRLDFPRQLAA